MSDHKRSIVRRAGGFLLGYVTPWRSIKRTADSVAGSAERIGDAFKSAGDSMRAQRKRMKSNPPLTSEQLKMSPQELFLDFYERGAWSEAGLERNRGLYRQAKWACYVVAAATAIAAFWMIIAGGSLLLTFFVAPLLLIGSLVVVSRGAIEAWKQAQVELREVISFAQFMSRPDFFKRIFW